VLSEAPSATQRHALLALILVGAAAIRLAGLADVPPGLYCDEASTGYDAWSLAQTGRDQYGERLPLYARSFGDYNEASYRYLAAPFTAVLGPTVTAVRLPAALAGVALVALLHLLGARLFSPRVGLIAAALGASSPWLVLFSRVAFRGILLPLALAAAIALFSWAVRNGRSLLPAAVVFSLALWTYTPGRLLVPAMAALCVALHGSALRVRGARARGDLVAAALFVGALATLSTFWFSDEGMARVGEEVRGSFDGVGDDLLAYLSPAFLFETGDANLRHSLPDWGLLLPFEWLTVAWGVGLCLRMPSRQGALLLGWVVLGVLPAALTTEGHALRAIGAAPAFILLSAAGLGDLLASVRRATWRRWLTVGAALAIAGAGYLSVWRTLHGDYRETSPGHWQWGMREGILALEASDRACRVVSADLFLPHVFILYHGRVPPERYQARPLESVTQAQMRYARFDLSPWHVAPLSTARGEHAGCVFLGGAREVAALRVPGLRIVDALYGPDGVHHLTVFVVDPPTP